jgi:protoporphyrin/coproporphyrin ferrochelatase
MNRKKLLLVNFGGPRDLKELFPFLKELLTDRDVIDSSLPPFLHRLFFTYIAKKRAKKVVPDYLLIGGKSPLFEDTEAVAEALKGSLYSKPLIFHRYLPATHNRFIKEIHAEETDQIIVFPLFPQFSYATTGSIARFFSTRLSPSSVQKMKWVKSYPTHPAYVSCMQKLIREFFTASHLKEEETILFFSPHGLPQRFIDRGDPYEGECRSSFQEIAKAFPRALCKLGFQSKFGRGEWIRPYTEECCKEILNWHLGYQQVLFVPLSFTSDHIETLFEVEYQYMPLIRERGLRAFRLPALNRDSTWIEAIATIIEEEKNFVENKQLFKR